MFDQELLKKKTTKELIRILKNRNDYLPAVIELVKCELQARNKNDIIERILVPSKKIKRNSLKEPGKNWTDLDPHKKVYLPLPIRIFKGLLTVIILYFIIKFVLTFFGTLLGIYVLTHPHG